MAESFVEAVSQYALQIFTEMNDSTDSLLEKNPRFTSYCEPSTRKTPRNNGALKLNVRSILPVRIQKTPQVYPWTQSRAFRHVGVSVLGKDVSRVDTANSHTCRTDCKLVI